MKIKTRYNDTVYEGEVAVNAIFSRLTDPYSGGAIELLQDQSRAVQGLLTAIINTLTREQQRAIIEELGFEWID